MATGKLVRDLIPDIIKSNGEQPKTRIMDSAEYLDELVKKLTEETSEFMADLSIEELADVQEVVLALADAISTRDALEETRSSKALARGTFKKRIYLYQEG